MHNFHSAAYVANWAANVDNPIRESVFHHIVAHLKSLDDDAPHIVELASGPGMLAEFLLSALPRMTYQGLDFSKPMLDLAGDRLGAFQDRATLHQVDLRDADWTDVLGAAPQAIISMQALHDVGAAVVHERLYAAARARLAPGGLLLNADFVHRGGEGPSRISIQRHLDMLSAAGFAKVKCTLDFSRYGCVVGFAP